MHHSLLFTTVAMSNNGKKLLNTTATPAPNPHANSPNNPSQYNKQKKHKHSPLATLDLLILLLVLLAGAFLVSSYLAYIFNFVSLLLPATTTFYPVLSHLLLLSVPYVFYTLLPSFFIWVLFSFSFRSRKRCGKKGCKGLKKALEFDLQLQTEDCLKEAAYGNNNNNRNGKGKGRDSLSSVGKAVREIDELPWKGGSEGNPDYECLRAELRKMAPPNGRAVLLFRAKCGCPIAKLEGWGPKRGKRQKKTLALSGGGGDSR